MIIWCCPCDKNDRFQTSFTILFVCCWVHLCWLTNFRKQYLCCKLLSIFFSWNLPCHEEKLQNCQQKYLPSALSQLWLQPWKTASFLRWKLLCSKDFHPLHSDNSCLEFYIDRWNGKKNIKHDLALICLFFFFFFQFWVKLQQIWMFVSSKLFAFSTVLFINSSIICIPDEMATLVSLFLTHEAFLIHHYF